MIGVKIPIAQEKQPGAQLITATPFGLDHVTQVRKGLEQAADATFSKDNSFEISVTPRGERMASNSRRRKVFSTVV